MVIFWVSWCKKRTTDKQRRLMEICKSFVGFHKSYCAPNVWGIMKMYFNLESTIWVKSINVYVETVSLLRQRHCVYAALIDDLKDVVVDYRL